MKQIQIFSLAASRIWTQKEFEPNMIKEESTFIPIDCSARSALGPLSALLLFFFLLVMMIVFHHEEYTIGNYGWSALMESYLSRDCVDKFGQGPKSHNYNYLSVAWK